MDIGGGGRSEACYRLRRAVDTLLAVGLLRVSNFKYNILMRSIVKALLEWVVRQNCFDIDCTSGRIGNRIQTSLFHIAP